MTCAHCCGAERIFDDRTARKDKKRYLKKGPNKATSQLIEIMGQEIREGQSLLDIGGGIGAIGLELTPHGLIQYTGIDASSAYQEVAKGLFEESSVQTSFLTGDFTDNATNTTQHDWVTLDKVICCFPYLDKLVNLAASRANKGLGLVYPRDGFLARVVASVANFFMRLTGNSFQAYIHSRRELHHILTSQGFKRLQTRKQFPWLIELWVKQDYTSDTPS